MSSLGNFVARAGASTIRRCAACNLISAFEGGSKISTDCAATGSVMRTALIPSVFFETGNSETDCAAGAGALFSSSIEVPSNKVLSI